MPTSPEVVPISPTRMDCQASVVRTLEALLEQAKAGDFIAVAVATVQPDLSVDSFWSLQDAMPTMLGAIQILNTRLMRDV